MFNCHRIGNSAAAPFDIDIDLHNSPPRNPQLFMLLIIWCGLGHSFNKATHREIWQLRVVQ
jgi:hypothetical protein